MEIGPQKYEYPINPMVPIVQTMGLYHTTSVVVGGVERVSGARTPSLIPRLQSWCCERV